MGIRKLLYIILLGLFLRLIFLFHHDVWFDEAVSILISHLPVKELIWVASYDNNPPLYYLLLHFWMKVSQNPIWLRALSLIFSTATIPAVFLLGRSLANQKTAIFTSLLVAIMPVQLYYAGEIRFYSLLILESTLLFYLIVRDTKSKKRRGYQFSPRTLARLLAWRDAHTSQPTEANRSEQENLIPEVSFVTFTILITALLLTHYYGFFVLAVALLMLVNNPAKLQGLIKSAILALLIVSPWFLYTSIKPHPAPWTPSPLLSLAFTPIAATTGLVGIAPPSTLPLLPPVPRFTIVALALLFLWLLKNVLQSTKAKAMFLMGTILCFAFITIAAIEQWNNLFIVLSPRLILPFTPLLYIFVAKALVNKTTLKILFLTSTSVALLSMALPLLRGPRLNQIISLTNKVQAPIIHSSITTFYPMQSAPLSRTNIYIGPKTFPTQMTDTIGGTPQPIQLLSQHPQILLIIDEKNTDDKTKNALKEQLNISHELIKEMWVDAITIQMYIRKADH